MTTKPMKITPSSTSYHDNSQKRIVMKAVDREKMSQSLPSMNYDPSDDSSFGDQSESNWSAAMISERPPAPPSVVPSSRKPNMLVRPVKPSPALNGGPKKIKKKSVRASDLEKIGIKIDKNTTPDKLEEAIRKWNSVHSKKSNDSADGFESDKEPSNRNNAMKFSSHSVDTGITGLVVGGERTEITSPGRDRPVGGSEAQHRSTKSQPAILEEGAIPSWEYLNATQSKPKGGDDLEELETIIAIPQTTTVSTKTTITTAQLRADAESVARRSRSHSPASAGLPQRPRSKSPATGLIKRNSTNRSSARRRSKSPGTGLIKHNSQNSSSNAKNRTPSRRGSKSNGDGSSSSNMIQTPSQRRGRSRDGRRTPSRRGNSGDPSKDLSKSPGGRDYKPVSWRVEDAAISLPNLDGSFSRKGEPLDEHEEIQLRLKEAGISKEQYRAMLAAGLRVTLA